MEQPREEISEHRQIDSVESKIKNHIRNYQTWPSLVKHLKTATIVGESVSGLHMYQIQKKEGFEGSYGKYSVHTIAGNKKWVITKGNPNTYHEGYIVCSHPSNTWVLNRKSFFPVTQTIESIKALIKNIDTAQIEIREITEDIYSVHVWYTKEKIKIKMAGMYKKTQDIFFISTIYPEIEQSDDYKQQESDIMLWVNQQKEKYEVENSRKEGKLEGQAERKLNVSDIANLEQLGHALENGLDANDVIDNKTLLMHAYKNKSYECINLLLLYGADPYKLSGSYSLLNKLMWEDGDPFVLSFIVQSLDQNQLNKLLIQAIEALNSSAVEVVVAQGADVNYQDNKGDAPLHHCVYNAHKETVNGTQLTEIVTILLNNGADVDQKNNIFQSVKDVIQEKKYTRSQMVDQAIDQFIKGEEEFYKKLKSESNTTDTALDLLWAIKTKNHKKVTHSIQDADEYSLLLAIDHAQKNKISLEMYHGMLQQRLQSLEIEKSENYNNQITKVDKQTKEQQEKLKALQLLEDQYTQAVELDDLSSVADAVLKELDRTRSLLCQAVKLGNLNI